MIALEPDLEAALLGCTHYPLVENLFRKHLPAAVITQGSIVAGKLADYLQRHPEISSRIKTDGGRTFLTTARDTHSELASRFYGEPVEFVSLTA
jgi:glutamate racemase